MSNKVKRVQIATVIPLKIPGSSNYYCGNDGEVYSAKVVESGLLLSKLTAFKTNDRDKHKKVTLNIFGDKKVFKVCLLIATAYHGNNSQIGMNVSFKDGNFENTLPSNLKWVLNRGDYAKILTKVTDENSPRNYRLPPV